jgi:pimeloyl-ACP methyl ester carboxylesterase
MGPRKYSYTWVVASLAAFLLSTTVLAAAPASSVAPASAGRASPPAVPAIAWRPCGADFPGVDCATARVPLDYDHPHGATTQLALARVPASDTRHRIGSLFVNPGGPGGSGVGFVRDGFGQYLEDQLDGRFDIVGFDPRGVGASETLHCFDSADDLNGYFGDQPLFPYQRAQYAPFFRTYKQLGEVCHDNRQRIIDHMNTADVARDLDLLRQAVGDRRLSYLGFSYGTYIGNTYANLYPDKIRALVIDGVLDPRLWSSGWQVSSDRVATGKEFNEALRLCDAAGPDCAFASGQPSRIRWERLASELRRHPLTLDDGFSYTYDFLIGDVVNAMYDPSVWGGPAGLGAYLDALADAVLGGQRGADIARLRAALLDRLAAPVTEADYDNGLDAYFGNQCADTQYPFSLDAFRAIDRYAARGSRFGPYWWWFNAGCAGWPVNHDRYGGPWSTHTSAPVLVVGNFFDGVTAYTGAQASSRLLGNSRLLSYAGWGHTAYGTSDCVTQGVNAYLLNDTLPAKGMVCPANPNPFLPQAVLRSKTHPKYVGLPPSWQLRR